MFSKFNSKPIHCSREKENDVTGAIDDDAIEARMKFPEVITLSEVNPDELSSRDRYSTR